jgi:hypothetical protein
MFHLSRITYRDVMVMSRLLCTPIDTYLEVGPELNVLDIDICRTFPKRRTIRAISGEAETRENACTLCEGPNGVILRAFEQPTHLKQCNTVANLAQTRYSRTKALMLTGTKEDWRQSRASAQHRSCTCHQRPQRGQARQGLPPSSGMRHASGQ